MDRNWKIHTLTPYGDGYASREMVDIASLPVVDFKMAFRSRAADEVRLVVETASPLATPGDVWQYLSIGKNCLFTCSWLIHGNTRPLRPMFFGTLVKMVPSDTGTASSAELVFLGGWYYLEQIVFRLSYDGVYRSTPRFSLSGVSANAWIQRAIKCAADFGNTGLYPDAVVDVSNMKIPELHFNSHSCAEAVERAISFWPDVQSWTRTAWTNADGIFPAPNLHVERLRDMPTEILPTDADDIPEPGGTEDPTGYSGSIMVFGNGKVVSQRFERIGVCPGVRVVNTDEGAVFEIGQPDKMGGLILEIGQDEAVGTNIFYMQGGRLCCDLPGDIWDACRAAGEWRGTVVVAGEEPPGLFTIRPDKYLGLGVDMIPSPIQSVEFDIGRGLTTIECGPSRLPAPEELISLAQATRHW